ncbi:hypothetical protein BSKO_05437 [Bryopsis sp. KO-2023]|nr:hypothetical protein BSKO_05437 [Bryopsis sp. KO-2023]
MGTEQRTMRAIITTEVEYELSMEDMKHVQDHLLGGAGLKIEIRNGVIAQAAFKEEKLSKGCAISKSVDVGSKKKKGLRGGKRNRSKSSVLERRGKRSRRCGKMDAFMREGCGEESRHLSAKDPIDLTVTSTSEGDRHMRNCADVNVGKQEEKDNRQLESEAKRASAPSADLKRSKADGGTVAGENISQEQVLENCGQNAADRQHKDEREAPESTQNEVLKEGDRRPSDKASSEKEPVEQENEQEEDEERVCPRSEGGASSVAEDHEEDPRQRVNTSTQRSDCFSRNRTTYGMGATGIMANEVISRRPVIIANTEPTKIFLPKSKFAVNLQWLCCPQVEGQVLDGCRCPSLNIGRTIWFQPETKEVKGKSQSTELGEDFLSIWRRELHASWDGAVVVLLPNSREDCYNIRPFVMHMVQDKWISISNDLSIGAIEGRMAVLPYNLLYQMEQQPTEKSSRIDSAIQWISSNFPMDVSAGQIMCGLFCKKPERR